jgi:hypothetical protein
MPPPPAGPTALNPCRPPLPRRSSARNLDTNEQVAIKKISNVFDNHVDSKRTFREIKLLRHMVHENIISIR